MRYAALALVALLFAVPASAQEILIPGSENALSISLSPEHPGPNTSVQLSLTSPLFDLDDSTITWRVGGTILTEGIGQKEARVTTSGLGQSTDISVVVSGPQGDSATQLSIIPTSVDLLWESNSLVPPFYKGRALPSAGSTVRIVAIPHLAVGGTSLKPEALNFEWRRNGAVLGSLSGRGKSSLIISAPTLFGSDLISLTVSAPDGSVSGEASLRLKDTRPELELYLDHPLFGILFHRALGSTNFIPENEMTFATYPIFAPVRSMRDPLLAYSWRVNQSDVRADASAPNEITINATNSNGMALIGVAIVHATNFFFGSEGSWQATFLQGAMGADPFYNQ